jgi:WD40 repeat protein
MSQDGVVTEVVVSSNSQWIATTGNDRTARVWDPGTGAEIFQIPLKANGARLAFTNDDKWLVSTDERGAIAIWDISVMTLPELAVDSDTIMDHVQYSPSGEWLAASSKDKVWLLQPEQQSILKERELGSPAYDLNANITELVFSHDSKLLGLLSEENEVAIFNIETGTQLPISISERIQSIAFTPDSQRLITSDLNGNLKAWDVQNAELLPDADGFPQGVALTSGGEVLAVGSQGKITVLNEDGNGAFPAIDSGDNALLVSSADGSLLASSSSRGEIKIFRYQGSQLTELTSFVKEQAASLAFHPNGTLLAVGTAKNVYLMEVASGREVARIPHLSTVNGVSFSIDGNYLATASSQALKFWDMAKLRQIKSDQLIPAACSYLYENFSSAQWEQFFAGEPYEPLCKDLPTPE